MLLLLALLALLLSCCFFFLLVFYSLRPFLTVEKIHSVFFQNTIFAVLAVAKNEKIHGAVFPKMRFDGIKFVFLQIGPFDKIQVEPP
jgi:hypothetical protein